jgi:hypothetical protein
METKSSRYYFTNWPLLFFIALIYVLSMYGCGGSSSGGGGVGYTGHTTPANIDRDNVTDLLIGAFMGGNTAASLSVFGAAQQTPGPVSYPRTLKYTDIFMGVIAAIDSSSATNNIYLGAVIPQEVDETGSCGGTVTGTLNIDDQSGAFDGNLTFNDFCENDYILDGPVTISGIFNPDTEEFAVVSLTFTNLSGSGAGESVTLNGDFDLDLSNLPLMTISTSMVIRDNILGKTFKLENWVIEITEGEGITDVDITGRYFDPDHGYVDITTQESLRFNDDDFWPSDGILIAEGAEGTAGGKTKARITFVDADTYEIDVDEDGDGEFDDYNSGPLLWADL